MRIFLTLTVFCLFYASVYAGNTQTMNVKVGQTFWLSASSHTGVVGVTWTWDTDCFEMTDNSYATYGQAEFRALKATPSSGAYIQATTRYQQSGAPGSYTDYDDWRIVVEDNSTVQLSDSYIDLEKGSTCTLIAIASSDYSGNYTWRSTNSKIAEVTAANAQATVHAIAAGRTEINVTLDNGAVAKCTVNVQNTNNPDPNPNEDYEIVDLGLSINWASKNIGANSPYDLGYRFAWGETHSKGSYTASNSTMWHKDIFRISGIVDSNYNLLPQYDAAHAQMGSNWRMPTKGELNELINKCQFEKCFIGGTHLFKVTGPSGKFIYLPYNPFSEIEGSYYWSSSSYSNIELAVALILKHNKNIEGNYVWAIDENRYEGYYVRGVTSSSAEDGVLPVISIKNEDLAVFNISGIYISNTTENLPSGYYIVRKNGKYIKCYIRSK